jgi:hypothetical protein
MSRCSKLIVCRHIELYTEVLSASIATEDFTKWSTMSRQVDQTLARQKHWEISLHVEPRIPALCNFKTSENYKKARQVRDAG